MDVHGDLDGFTAAVSKHEQRLAGLRVTKATELGTARLIGFLPVLRSTLQTLELVGCWHLLEWPPMIEMPLLRSIRIVGSRLRSLPDLRGCPALEEIDLHDNQIGPELVPMADWIHPDARPATIDISYNKWGAEPPRPPPLPDGAEEDEEVPAMWRLAFPVEERGILSVDLSFNFLKRGPPADLRAHCNFVLHHNEIDVRDYCRGEVFALDPATGVWRSTRTGQAEQPWTAVSGNGIDNVRHAVPLPDWPGAFTAAAQAPERARVPRVFPDVLVRRGAWGGEPPTYTHRQSVHGTEVQKGAKEAVGKVIRLASPHPRLETGELLRQIWAALYLGVPADAPWWRRALGFLGGLWPRRVIAWSSVRASCDDESTVYGVHAHAHAHTHAQAQAQGTYLGLLERIWAVIEHHEHRDLLRVRLREEIEEGVGMCFTGRVTRLFNALHGVVDGVHLGVSDREAMQARVSRVLAKLSKKAVDAKAVEALRADLVRAIDDCPPGQMMPGERDAWLEAFDDAVTTSDGRKSSAQA